MDSRIPGISPALSNFALSSPPDSNFSQYYVNELWSHQAASKTASEVKIESAGEIGNPNLLHD